jgi:hypothetical protein
MERVVIDMRYFSTENNDALVCDSGNVELESLNRADAEDGHDAKVAFSAANSANGEFKRRKRGSLSESSRPQQESEPADDGASNGFETENISREATCCGQDWGSHFATLFSLLSCPTVLLTFLQGAPGCLPWGIVNSFLNDFLAEDRGMTVEVSFVVL